MPIGKQLTSQSQREVKKFFDDHGMKKAFERETGIDDGTLSRACNSGRAMESTFKQMSSFSGIQLQFKKTKYKPIKVTA